MPTINEMAKLSMGVSFGEGIDMKKSAALLAQLEKVLKSVIDEGAYMKAALHKTADAITQDIYVPRDKAQSVLKGFEAVRAANTYSNMSGETVNPITYSKNPIDVHTKSFTRAIHNKRDQADIAAQVSQAGGSFGKSSRDGYYDITVPEVDNYRQTANGKPLSFEQHISSRITRANKQVNERAKEEEQEQNAIRSRESLHRMKNKERLGWLDDEESGGRGSKGGNTGNMGALKMLSKVMAAVYLLEKLLDLVGKIFNFILAGAGQAQKDILTGLRLGLSATEVRTQRTFAESKGLPSDIFQTAQAGVESKFGNITSLDKESLGKLALVLGSSIKEMVNLGLGKEDPNKVLGTILDGFTKRAMSGVNSLGQNVGVEKALTELTSYLGKIDSSWGTLLNRRAMDALDPNASQRQRTAAGGSQLAWEQSFINNPVGITNNDSAMAASVKSLADEIKSLWKAIMDGIAVKMSGAMLEFFGGMRNGMRAGMDDTAKELDVENARKDNASRGAEFATSRKGLVANQNASLQAMIAANPAYQRNPGLLAEDLARFNRGDQMMTFDRTSEAGRIALQGYAGAQAGLDYIDKTQEKIDKENAADDTKYVKANISMLLRKIADASTRAGDMIGSDAGAPIYNSDGSITYAPRPKAAVNAAGGNKFTYGAGVEKTTNNVTDAMIFAIGQAQINKALTAEGKTAPKGSEVKVSIGNSLMTVVLKNEKGDIIKELKSQLNISTDTKDITGASSDLNKVKNGAQTPATDATKAAQFQENARAGAAGATR